MKSMKEQYWILVALGLLWAGTLQGQQATVFGTIKDAETGEPLSFATVQVGSRGKAANEDGAFRIRVGASEEQQLIFSYTNYKPDTLTLFLGEGEQYQADIRLMAISTGEVVVEGRSIQGRDPSEEKVNVKPLKLIPTVSLNFEQVLSVIGLGVNSGTGGELSAQYSVRGGSYDENLIYVNDFEIYRPFLIRSGQQEGLTFPNIDLIRDISFSSGGFDAKYGDKLSSVLNINYKRPDSTRASVQASLLGGSAHLEGGVFQNPNNKSEKAFRYLLGARYKTTRYLLGSLDLTGEYAPNFFDFQAMLSYDFNERWQLSWIGNYNHSQYRFQPNELVSTLGLINQALQFRVLFEGQEIDDFTTYMNGLTLTHINQEKHLYLKLLASQYGSQENEKFDIIGYYSLGELETDLGSDDFGEVVGILGTGTEHNYARNYLTTTVANVAHKGGWEWDTQGNGTTFLQWGVKAQQERITDQLNEWERIDSAGYSLLYNTDSVFLNTVYKTDTSLQSARLSGFVQNTWNYSDSLHDLSLTAGVRAQYWTLNGEWIVMPRARLLYKPRNWQKDVSFKLATGLYHQPAFYRELRNQQGQINTAVRAQKSYHLVVGGTYDFVRSDRKFRLLAEAYYKHLWDIVPYDVENVRIRYYGDNLATGYATGLDLRLNGELVKGAESWINLSFLRTREQFTGVDHLRRTIDNPDTVTFVRDVPRPTDRFLNLSMFFQDYLPQNENFKVHLALNVGTGLPFGLPEDNVTFRNLYRISPYRRVDIGFSALLWNESWRYRKPHHPLRAFENAWVSLEVFNLLRVSNTASHTWVKTIFLQQYAVPNYLTSRRINLRFKFDL